MQNNRLMLSTQKLFPDTLLNTFRNKQMHPVSEILYFTFPTYISIFMKLYNVAAAGIIRILDYYIFTSPSGQQQWANTVT